VDEGGRQQPDLNADLPAVLSAAPLQRESAMTRAESWDASVLDAFAGAPSPHRAAEQLATEWQIIVALRTLFERDPGLVSALLRQASANDVLLVQTVYAAVREALADGEPRPDLYAQAALAAVRLRRWDEAESFARHALRLDPQHRGAQSLVTRITRARDASPSTQAVPVHTAAPVAEQNRAGGPAA